MPRHPLTNFEIQKYHENEPKYSGLYSRNEVSKIKDGKHIINLDQCESVGTHWIALHVNAKNVTNFESFRVEHIPKQITKLIRNKNIMTNIYKIQAYDSIMRGYFCTGFIDFMLKGKNFL